MNLLTPKTLESDVEEQFRAIVLSHGKFIPQSDPLWVQLYDLCDKLQAVDVRAGSVRKAELFLFAGKFQEAEYWANNVKKNGDSIGAAVVQAIIRSNIGYASSAASVLPQALDVRNGEFNRSVKLAFACGGFSDIVEAADRFIKAGGRVEREDLVIRAKAAKAVLSELGTSEACFRRLMDEAGALLRENSLLWLNESPDVVTSQAGQHPHITLNYRIRENPKKAAEMTWQLAEAAARKELIFPDVSVGFLGQRQSV